ncbi:MAG: pentapeptide repeat-containing protein [Cyanobacteria bacterium P01_A01_bin.40]
MMSGILNCGQAKQESELVRFDYQCPKYWDNLQATEDESIRFCDACQENVFYCSDKQEAEQHALQGHCIAIARKLTNAVDKQYKKPHPPVMGMMKANTLPEQKKAWAKDIFDYQKHQLVRAIRNRKITVTKIDYKDLSHADLSGVDLSYADLSGVDLFNTNLSGANLSHANLSGANLVKTNLSHANLSGIDLGQVLQESVASPKANRNGIDLVDPWEDSFASKKINIDGATLEPKDKIKYLIYRGRRYKSKEKDRAIECFQQALSINQELSNCGSEASPTDSASGRHRATEAKIIWQLASIHLLEDRQKAEKLYQQALSISQEIGDRYSEAQILNKFGNIYLRRQAKLEALKYFQQAQIIFEELDNRQKAASNIRSLISIHEDIGSNKYLLIEHYQKLLFFDPNSRGMDELAVMYQELGDEQQAFEYSQQAISLRSKLVKHQQLIYLGAEIYLLKAIIEIYESLSDFSGALEYYQQLLSFKRSMSIRPPEVASFNRLIQYYWKSSETQNPTKLLQDLLRLKTDKISLSNKLIDLCIGKLYLEQGEKQKAIKHYEQGIVEVRQLRRQPQDIRTYTIKWYNSDRKRLLEVIDRLNNRSDITLNLSPYCQQLLQDRENNRLEIEQLIEKITAALIMLRYT